MEILLSERIFALSWIRDPRERQLEWITEQTEEMAALIADIGLSADSSRRVGDDLTRMESEIVGAIESDAFADMVDHASSAFLRSVLNELPTRPFATTAIRQLGIVVDRMKNLARAVEGFRNPAR